MLSYPLLDLKYQIEHTSRSWSQMLPPKLYLFGVIKWSWWTGQRWFLWTSDLLLGSVFSSTTCSYPLGVAIIKCSSMVVSVKYSVSWTHLSIRSAHSVFSLGYYWLLNKQLIISEFFHSIPPKLGWLAWNLGLLRLLEYVCQCINMLGIMVESYEHVLSPLGFYFFNFLIFFNFLFKFKFKFFHKT